MFLRLTDVSPGWHRPDAWAKDSVGAVQPPAQYPGKQDKVGQAFQAGGVIHIRERYV